ncbi:MAG: hypothetical protein KUG77_09385 [Nannocystaceae bacterium]|nr:hypothetical protein [Nannocystaceae bacterium]
MDETSTEKRQRKRGIHTLLKGIETGAASSVDVIHPQTYIQHNPQTQTRREGLATLFARRTPPPLLHFA